MTAEKEAQQQGTCLLMSYYAKSSFICPTAD